MLLATTQVEDFDRFLEVFSTKGADKRRQHGSKGAIVFRDPSEADRVWVAFDWDEAGLAELRLRPRCPADPEGGRAQGQAAGRPAGPQHRRLTRSYNGGGADTRRHRPRSCPPDGGHHRRPDRER